ncbi:MAG: hydroxyacid dehydrogenase [Candidatus Aenigmarchaeota archaeon]|nr:hydroxyacid dehydrogenase [Candidatus Aenigmarchaeota archaeon]
MKILITEPDYFPEKSLIELKKLGEVTAKKFDRKELMEKIEEFDIVIVRIDTKLDREIIEKAKKLKIIGSVTTGVNHIDIESANKREIKIIHLEGAHTNSAAEHTFALIMALLRNIPYGFDSLRNGSWNRHEFIGHELKDKTLGIIGFGRIGSRIAVFANAFNMKIIAYDKYVDAKNVEKLGVQLVNLDKLLKESDIITINCILTEETKEMIGIKEFEMMKKNAFLINTSRGEVIDENSLLNALKTGKIKAAALDVISDESKVVENPLSSKIVQYAKNHKNLILTPHLAGSTHESINDATMFIIEKIREIIKDKK